MSFLDLVNRRYSVRKYLPTPVEQDKLERCLEAVRLAPSACNAQPWFFLVVDRPDLIQRIADETTTLMLPLNQFVKKAPVIVVVIAEKANMTSRIGAIVKNKEYNWIDLGIAAEHFCLQAAEEGLGTCMVGWFNESPIKELLGIPKSKRIGLLVTVGYTESDEPKHRPRKSIGQIRSFNTYTPDSSNT